MAKDARHRPASAKLLSKLLRRAIFWGLGRTYPFAPALPALSPRDRRIVRDMRTIRRSGLFDTEWYLSRYPDVAGSGIDPLEHYCRYGWRRGRDPNRTFSTALYVIRHPEAAKEGNPLAHYARCRARGSDPVAGHTTQAGAAGACPETFELAKVWYREDAPAVSLIILNFNKAHLTGECLRSVWRHTEGYPYEIIVVDNGSDPADFAALTAISGPFRLVRLQTNRFFGEGNNIGAESARAGLVCFMNNDIIVTPHWLEPLMQVHERHPDCGAVGPKFVYPDGFLQEAGALIDAAGDVKRLGHGANANDEAYNRLTQVDYVSAATMLLSRATFESVLGFDLAWDPAYYEDADLCLKISGQDLKIYYCPESTVVHYESVTTNDTSQPLRLDNLKEVNRQKFVTRWGDRLRRNGSEAPASPTYANSCTPIVREPLQRLAIYAPDQFYPGGSERYLLAFADALNHTHQTWLITSERYSRMRAYTVARELGIELESVNVASLDELAGMERFDIAVVAGSEILPPVPPLARRTFYYCHLPFGVPSGELARRWAWWNRYERCLVSSDRVRQTIIASLRELHLPEKPLDLIPPPSTPLNVEGSSLCFKENIILHVGHFCEGGTSKHQDKLISAFGKLLDGGIMAQLHLAGVVRADVNSRNFFLYCRKITDNLPVYFHPNVPRQQLEALYRRSACFWAWAGQNKHQTTPEWIAASARISIREAQSAGCICVIVDGNAGLGEVQNGLDGFVVDGAGDLVRLTHRALMEKDAPWATDMRSRAVERAGSISASFQERCRELVSSGAAQEH